MAAQDHPSQRAPPSRALLRAARRAGCLAQASAARTPCREQEAQGLEIAPFDSGPRSDPRGRADGHCPNTPSLPCQAAALEIRSEEHTSELQSLTNLVCRLLLEKKKKRTQNDRNRNKEHKTNNNKRQSEY